MTIDRRSHPGSSAGRCGRCRRRWTAFVRQLGTYPTPGRAWFSKSLFLGSKLPRGPGKPFPKVGGEVPHLLEGSPGPPGQLRPPTNKDLENHARPGVGYAPSCLFVCRKVGSERTRLCLDSLLSHRSNTAVVVFVLRFFVFCLFLLWVGLVFLVFH